MVRKLILAGALLAVAAGPAAAQVSLSPFKAPDKRPMTQEELEKKKAADAAYKAAMDKIPEKKTANDPWGNIREAPTSDSSATAKATTKTSAKTKPQQ